MGFGSDFQICENCNVDSDSYCYGGDENTYSIP